MTEDKVGTTGVNLFRNDDLLAKHGREALGLLTTFPPAERFLRPCDEEVAGARIAVLRYLRSIPSIGFRDARGDGTPIDSRTVFDRAFDIIVNVKVDGHGADAVVAAIDDMLREGLLVAQPILLENGECEPIPSRGIGDDVRLAVSLLELEQAETRMAASRQQIADQQSPPQLRTNSVDGEDQLRKFAIEKMKGKQQRTVLMILDAGGSVPISDLAIQLEWGSADDNFNSTRREINKKLNLIAWDLIRHGGNAKLERLSKDGHF